MFKVSMLSVVLLLSGGAMSYAKGPCERISESVTGSEFEVKISRYEPEQDQKSLILLMPPTGGINFIDKSYAWNLCKQGFHVVILEHWSGDDEQSFDLEIHDRLYSRAQRAIDLVISKHHHDYLGILGTSVGGLHAAVAVGLGKSFNGAFVITGGAPIPSIIVDSDQQAMKDAKKERYKKYGFKSDEEYLKALDQVFPLDPFKQNKAQPGMDIALVIATEDETVPTLYQQELRKLWNPKTVYEYPNGHRWAIVKSWLWHRQMVVDFFVQSRKGSLPKSGDTRRPAQ